MASDLFTNIISVLLIISSAGILMLVSLTLWNMRKREQEQNPYLYPVTCDIDDRDKELAIALHTLSIDILRGKIDIQQLEMGQGVQGKNGEEFHPDNPHELYERIVIEYKLKGR